MYNLCLILMLSLDSSAKTPMEAIDSFCFAIASRNHDTRIKALDKVRVDPKLIKEFRKKLTTIIKDGMENPRPDDSPREVALEILVDHVDYTIEPAIIQLLVDNMDVCISGPIRGQPSIDKASPAVRGLLRIGQPATEYILKKIKSTDDKTTQISCGFWFCKHYGQKMALRFFDDLLAENPKMPLQDRKRLVHVLELIEKNTW